MAEISFSKFPVLIVKRNSPAWQAIIRICKEGVKPGACYPVSDEEFDSLKNDVIEFESPTREEIEA